VESPEELSPEAKALVGKSWEGENGTVTLGDHGLLSVGDDDTGSWELDGDQVIIDGPHGRSTLPLDEVSGK